MTDISYRALFSLFSHDQIPRVQMAIAKAVEKTFPPDVRNATRADLKYRAQQAANIVAALRGDLKWSIFAIEDHLPRFLAAELNGDKWNAKEDMKSWSGDAQTVAVDESELQGPDFNAPAEEPRIIIPSAY